jgi:hypothetical protein
MPLPPRSPETPSQPEPPSSGQEIPSLGPEAPILRPPSPETIRQEEQRQEEQRQEEQRQKALRRKARLKMLICVRIPRVIAQAFCILAMIALVGLVASIWQGWLIHRISLEGFHKIRKGLAIFVALYAIWCVLRLTYKVAIPRTLNDKFVRELIAFSVFWVLAPPIWFFVEYFAVASDWICGLPQDKTEKMEYLKTIKDYADYASKIWAGVLALLLGLIALKK